MADKTEYGYRSRRTIDVGLILLALGVSETSFAQRLIPLNQWWSPDRKDYLLTTNPDWNGQTGATKSPGYKWIGRIGKVISPMSPQPPDTAPLYSWYSASRGDNFITSDPVWRPRSPDDTTRNPDYRLVRLEGYIYTQPLAGTAPLVSFWNPAAGDNHATTDQIWMADVGCELLSGYTVYRTEGFVVAPEASELKALDRRRSRVGRRRSSKVRSQAPCDVGKFSTDPDHQDSVP